MKTKRTPIVAVLFEDPEAWLRENINDFGWDAVSSVYPSERINLDGLTRYVDEQENTSKRLGLKAHVKALFLLCKLIGGKELFVGGIKNPADLLDPGCWDSEVVDAYFQLVYYGEVIYG